MTNSFALFTSDFDHDFSDFVTMWLTFWGWKFLIFGELRILKSSGFKDPQILRISKSSNVTIITFGDIDVLRI